MDAVVDRNLPDDLNLTSIFREVIGHKLSDGSSGDLYTRCRINFGGDPVQIQTPQCMNLWFSTINALDESIVLSNPDTRIRQPADGYHLISQDHVFRKATLVGMSLVYSDHDYKYKTDFQIWK